MNIFDASDSTWYLDTMTHAIKEAQDELDLIRSYSPSIGEEKAQMRLDVLLELQNKMRRYP